jgi:hypothetical protein
MIERDSARTEPGTLQSNQWMILFSVGLGLFMVVIDISILNIAMPTLAGNMNASLEEIDALLWTNQRSGWPQAIIPGGIAHLRTGQFAGSSLPIDSVAYSRTFAPSRGGCPDYE